MHIAIERYTRWVFLLGILFCIAARPSRVAAANDEDAAAKLYKTIQWTEGPATVDLGTMGKLTVPPGYRFANSEGARTWSQITQNPPSNEIGVLTPPVEVLADSARSWFVLFNYDAVGYVKDNESLDSSTIDQILDQIKTATNKGNEERASHGWPSLTIQGWAQRPFYEPTNQHLTWAISAVDSGGAGVVNYQSRVLGRRGVMRVTMVLAPALVASNTPIYNNIVSGISFNPGDTYQEFRAGDKVAEYGLIGLISGGAAVAAVKLWKPLMAFGALIVAGIGSIFRKIKRFITGSPSQTPP